MAEQYKFLNETVTADPSTPLSTPTGVDYNGVISVDQLKPATQITLPEIPSTSGTAADSLVSGATGAQKSLTDYISSLTPPTTELDTKTQTLLDEISSLTGQSTGKTQATAQAKIDAGVPDLNKQLAELNGQITVGNAAYAQLTAKEQADLAKAESTARSAFDYTGSTGAIQRQYLAEKATKAAEIGMYAARAQAVAGNLTVALQIAQNAVDAKYGPIEDGLKVKQAQLAAIKPQLDKQEKIQALALERKYNDEQKKLEEEKANQKQVQSIMVQAAQSGASPETLQAIQKAASIEEAIAIAGYDLGAEFRQKVAQQKFENDMQSAQLAISRGNLSLSRERLNFEKTKEAFDQAQKLNPSGQASPVMQQAVAKSNIDLVGSLLTDKNLKEVVGPNAFSKGFLEKLTSGQLVTNIGSPGRNNFIAGVEQLRSQLSLDSLIRAKANGATFGALSEGELKLLSASASRLSTWAETDKNGKVTGYKVSEADFNKELNKINNFAKLDYVLKGGSPEDVNIKREADGSYTTINPDGTITNLGQ